MTSPPSVPSARSRSTDALRGNRALDRARRRAPASRAARARRRPHHAEPLARGRAARRRGATTRSTSGRPTRTTRRRAPRRRARRRRPYGGSRARRRGPAWTTDDAVARQAPGEQPARSVLRCLARRAAEDGRVDRQAAPARGRDLRPAGGRGVAGLDADQPGKRPSRSFQVESERPAATSSRGRRPPYGRPRIATRASRVTSPGAREVARRVEAVGRTKCVSRRPSRAPWRSSADEALDVAAAGVERERLRGVVRALDQRGLDQVADGDPLAGARFSDDSPTAAARRSTTTTSSGRALERDEHGHQLRDARDRKRSSASCAEHLARRAVLDEPRAGVDVGRGAAAGAARTRAARRARSSASRARSLLRDLLHAERCPTGAPSGRRPGSARAAPRQSSRTARRPSTSVSPDAIT